VQVVAVSHDDLGSFAFFIVGEGEIAEEKDKGGEDVELDRIHVPDPFAGDIFLGKETGTKKEVLEGDQGLCIIMDYISEEMVEQVAERFVGNGIFLTTMGTVALRNFRAAVEAVFICPGRLCFQMIKVLVL
jgi:hypothetical protein